MSYIITGTNAGNTTFHAQYKWARLNSGSGVPVTVSKANHPNITTILSRQRLYILDDEESYGMHLMFADTSDYQYNKLSIAPSGTHGSVTFTSLTPSIATVNSSGVVTAISSGTARIRIDASGDANYNAFVGTEQNGGIVSITCSIDTWRVDNNQEREYKVRACSPLSQEGYNITTYGTPNVEDIYFSDDGNVFLANGTNDLIINASIYNETSFFVPLTSGYVIAVEEYFRDGDLTFSIETQYNSTVPKLQINRFTLDVYDIGSCEVVHGNMTTNSGIDYVKVRISNTGDSTKYTLTNLYQSQENTITWGNVTDVTYGYRPQFEASGGTKIISKSNIIISQSGTYTSGSSAGGSLTSLSFSQTSSATGFTFSTSGSGVNTTATVTASNNTTTTVRTGNTVRITATGSGGKTKTCDVTFGQDAGAKVYSSNPVINQYAYLAFAGECIDLTPTNFTCTQEYTWNGVASSSGTETYYLNSSGITWNFTANLSNAPDWISTGTNFESTGQINVSSRGTTLGNSRSFDGYFTVVASVVSSHRVSNAVTNTGTQTGNYVTAVTATNGSNNGGPHFGYTANITAGATSASPQLMGGAVYTFASGGTVFDSRTSPSFGGTATYTREYTLGTVQNGFTAVNQTSGVLTATNRGTTTGAARTSGTVTATLVITYTHPSAYSSGGTVISNTKTDTDTCTQMANYLTWGDVSFSSITPATPYAMDVKGEVKQISVTVATQTATYSSGSSDTFTPGIDYTVTTSKDGYSFNTSTNEVSVTNNTSISARNGYVVTVTARGKTGTNSTYESGYNKTATSARTFNQAAGVKTYGPPVISGYTYSQASKTGVTDLVPVVNYTQTWAWNGVAGTGGTDTNPNDGEYSFSCSSGTPDRFSTGTNFATTGKINWGNNNTTSVKDAASYLTVTVTRNGKTSSSAKTCASCIQTAGSKVYSKPTVNTFSYATYAATGDTKSPSVTYSMPYTWNSVSADSGTDTTGGTLAYSKGALTSGATADNNYGTNGKITWANNTTTSSRSTHSVLTVTVKAPGNITSDAKTCTACTQSAGAKVYSKPTVNTFTYATFAAAGETKTPTVTYSMPYTWNGVSGSGGSDATGGTLTYHNGTMTTGAIADSNYDTNGKITWDNNCTTSSRSTHSVLTVTVKTPTGNQTSDAKTCTACTQSAGSKVYSEITNQYYNYSLFPAYGATWEPTIEYRQTWTWNGVTGSGGTIENEGAVLTFSTSGTLPSGFSTESTFASDGKVTWANRTNVEGSVRSARSNLSVLIELNGKSKNVTCMNCDQAANAVESISLAINGRTDSTSVVYGSTIASSNIVLTGTYTSGNTGTVTPSEVISSDTTVVQIL